MGRRVLLVVGLVAGLATAQIIVHNVPDPLELAHLDAGSIYTDYVQVARVDAGRVRTDLLEVGIIDAGTVYGGRFANSDGGRVEAPAGVNVQSGSLVDFGSGSSIVRAPGALALNGGGAPIVSIDGHQVQGILEANTLAVDSLELIGGTGSATVRTSAGVASATPDAGLRLQAGAPDGLVTITNPSGVRTARVEAVDAGWLAIGGQGASLDGGWFRPLPWTEISECTSALRGVHVYAVPAYNFGEGLMGEDQYCDGEHWRAKEYTTTIRAPGKAGSAPFFTFYATRPGALTYIQASIQDQGAGVGSAYELIFRQGNTIKCRGGGLCTTPAGTVLTVPCVDHNFSGRADAGLLVGEVDAGCSQTPGLAISMGTVEHGYPRDGGWEPLP